MIKVLGLAFLGLLGLIYWGEFVMVNPFKNDLKVICETISSNEMNPPPPSFMHNESKQVFSILKRVPKDKQKEILQDFAKSKRIAVQCL